MTGRRSKVKGYKVINEGDRVRLEEIPYYGKITSQKQRARSSKKQKVVRRTTP